MTEKCTRCRQYHTGTCGTPQVCFRCGQIGHVKRFYPMIVGSVWWDNHLHSLGYLFRVLEGQSYNYYFFLDLKQVVLELREFNDHRGPRFTSLL